MRYSKRALLLFGAGLLLGLILVSANLDGIALVGSLAMATGLLLLPAALVADWWSHRPWRKPPSKSRKRPAGRRQPTAATKSSPPRKRGSRSK